MPSGLLRLQYYKRLFSNMLLSYLWVLKQQIQRSKGKHKNLSCMKKLILSAFFLVLAVSLFAQVKFDLGVKGGVNFSKVSFDADDYSAESVTKSHFGVFGRIGWDRIFIQPEFYFSGKGGVVTSDLTSTMTSFNYKSMDIPVLLGIRVIKGKIFDLHVVGGPVFSSISSEEINGSNLLDKMFYEDNYFGIQYGLGIDVLFLTFDARMENGIGKLYSDPTFAVAGKNQTFMLSVGFKIF